VARAGADADPAALDWLSPGTGGAESGLHPIRTSETNQTASLYLACITRFPFRLGVACCVVKG
jgi:hypothetical protein